MRHTDSIKHPSILCETYEVASLSSTYILLVFAAFFLHPHWFLANQSELCAGRNLLSYSLTRGLGVDPQVHEQASKPLLALPKSVDMMWNLSSPGLHTRLCLSQILSSLGTLPSVAMSKRDDY